MLPGWGRAWWNMEIWGVSKEKDYFTLLVSFPFAMVKYKYPNRSNLKERFYLAHNSRF